MKNFYMLILFLIFISTGCSKPVSIIDMVPVEGGAFIMGDDNGNDNEKPAHKVTITNDFYIGKYEITFEEYDSFCIETKKKEPMDYGWGRGNMPVVGVSFFDACDFCNWLSRKGKLSPCYSKKKQDRGEIIICDFKAEGYRLPTEAEWEFAAKGGNKSKGFKYSGSDDPDEVAWYGANSGGTPHQVGQKKQNELGIFDMNGNVLEWLSDCYDGKFYVNSPAVDPAGPAEDKWNKSIRSGAFDSSFLALNITFRNSEDKITRSKNTGFRVVRNKIN